MKPSPWRAFWEIVIRFEGDKLAPALALRNTLGITLPLIAGVLVGAVPGGVIVSTGALNVAFSDSSEPYARRGRRMLIASVLVAIAVFVGGVSARSNAAAVAITTLWAFTGGILVALGATAADMGIISLVTLIVFSAQPMEPRVAAISSLLAFAGGILQTLLSLALWPVRRYEPERRALSELYLELSRMAEAPIRSTEAPPASRQTTQAQMSLSTISRSRSLENERYALLLSQAERIRLSLMTLARLRIRMRREIESRLECEVFDKAFTLSAKLLDAIGKSILEARPAKADPAWLEELQALTESMRALCQDRSSSMIAMKEDALHQMDALAGQMRSALSLSANMTPEGLAAFERGEAGKPWRLRLEGSMVKIRANLSLKSSAFRHAVRLAVCMALGDALARGMQWPRHYWVPMTIAIVLKPDFSATFSRGVLRLAGTFTGLLLATGLFHLLPLGVGGEVALVALSVFVLRCFGPANYGIMVVAITGFVVLMFAITGVAPNDVISSRGPNTVAGGAIALLAYWIWPTWERTQVSEALAQLLDAYREYFRAVRDAYTRPDAALSSELDGTRLAGRLARSNLEASIDRLMSEPGTGAAAMARLTSVLASSHRLVHAMMALEAGLASSGPLPAREPFITLCNHIELTLYYLAAALRGSTLGQTDLPDLREDHHAMVRQGDS
ncbi:MAG: FUSC family protein, partial [Bryobacteraceae bacterium]